MANQLFQESQQNNLAFQFNNFKQNPIGFLLNRNMNIPQEIQNNPKEIVQHLLNNGKLTQNNLNHLIQMANNMGFKI